MAFPYATVLVKNPKTKLKEVRARAVSYDMTTRELYSHVAKKTSLTASDVAACIESFLEEVTDGLRNGQNIVLGEFGKFYPTLRSEASTKEDSFNPAMITKVRIRFLPFSTLKDNVNADLTFTKSITKKDAAKAKKAATQAQNAALHAQAQ